jgi:type IV pilus assembly protein PilB
MLDAIGENPLFVNSIRLVTAQRLIRRLDDSTKQPYKPTEAELSQLQKVFETLPKHVERPDLANMTLYKPGKSDENPFGFTGQLAIRELMLMTPQMQLLLRKPPREISTDEIEKTAIQAGMFTMLQDGLIKVTQGLTTMEEVFRVVG